MENGPLAALALAALLVTAGCQAPAAPDAASAATGTPTPATTSTDATEDGALVETDADFPFDPAAVYARVGRSLGVPADERPEVQIRVSAPPDGSGSATERPNGFEDVMGVAPERADDTEGSDDADSDQVRTLAVARGTLVTVYDYGETDADRLERILAHEFVHVYQTRADIQGPLLELDPERNTQFLYLTVVEGAATFVAEQYRVDRLGQRVDRDALPDGWRNASAYARWTLAPYHYGSRYYAARLDDAAAVDDVYANPPRSAEQVVHGLAPDAEPVAPLDVTVPQSSSYRWMDEATKGELFVRVALSTELGWERAAAAAAGWGADRVLTLSGEHGPGYAWVLRWDDSGEADEFAAAFDDYAANRSRPFATERLGEETVVVFAGADEFVANASASGTSGNVTVAA